MKPKWFFTAVLTVFLVLFPLISWYYLKQGIQYRKERLDSLARKIPLAITEIPLKNGDTISLNNRMNLPPEQANLAVNTLLVCIEDDRLYETIEGLFEQFSGIPFFKFLLVPNTNQVLRSAKLFELEILPGDLADEMKKFLTNHEAKDISGRIYLVDADAHLRRSYPLDNLDSIRVFIQEAALLIPPKSGQKLIFERRKEK